MNRHPENDTLTLTPKMTENTFATNTEQFLPISAGEMIINISVGATLT